MGITYAKQELEKKRARKKKDKAEKRLDRKSNNDKGKTVEEMFVYVDEMGRISNVPPVKSVASPKPVLATKVIHTSTQETFIGVVSQIYTDKGIGYITEKDTRSSVPVQLNQLSSIIKLRDQVSFEKKSVGRGVTAIRVQKVN